MAFIKVDIESILFYLDRLEAESTPLWGGMNAQQMVEHLTDMIRVSNGSISMDLLIPEEKLPKMIDFLNSDLPMPRNFVVPFVDVAAPLRNEELELAIDELVDEWLAHEEHFEVEGQVETHPYYGPLNKEMWSRIHSKHFTHHFTQFGLIEE